MTPKLLLVIIVLIYGVDKRLTHFWTENSIKYNLTYASAEAILLLKAFTTIFFGTFDTRNVSKIIILTDAEFSLFISQENVGFVLMVKLNQMELISALSLQK